jgi:hypothetical protein
MHISVPFSFIAHLAPVFHTHQHRYAVQACASAPNKTVVADGGPGIAALTMEAVSRRGGRALWLNDAAAGECVDAAVFAVGAGDPAAELERWAAAAASQRALGCVGIFVARQIVLPELVALLTAGGGLGPWVVVRPGALVADDGSGSGGGEAGMERMLVTDDVRCNGILSRERVAAVLARLALNRAAVEEVNGKVLGVYDRSRMISHPRGVREYCF